MKTKQTETKAADAPEAPRKLKAGLLTQEQADKLNAQPPITDDPTREHADDCLCCDCNPKPEPVIDDEPEYRRLVEETKCKPPQHSRLPWEHNATKPFNYRGARFEGYACAIYSGKTPVCMTDKSVGKYKAADLATQDANAKYIVRCVNNAEKLAEALNDMFVMIDENTLHRNISLDHRPDYHLRMMKFVQRLQKNQAALADWQNGAQQ